MSDRIRESTELSSNGTGWLPWENFPPDSRTNSTIPHRPRNGHQPVAQQAEKIRDASQELGRRELMPPRNLKSRDWKNSFVKKMSLRLIL